MPAKSSGDLFQFFDVQNIQLAVKSTDELLKMRRLIMLIQHFAAGPTLKEHEGARFFQIAMQIILQVTQLLAARLENGVHRFTDCGLKSRFRLQGGDNAYFHCFLPFHLMKVDAIGVGIVEFLATMRLLRR